MRVDDVAGNVRQALPDGIEGGRRRHLQQLHLQRGPGRCPDCSPIVYRCTRRVGLMPLLFAHSVPVHPEGLLGAANRVIHTQYTPSFFELCGTL
jgi:hypothetical protein